MLNQSGSVAVYHGRRHEGVLQIRPRVGRRQNFCRHAMSPSLFQWSQKFALFLTDLIMFALEHIEASGLYWTTGLNWGTTGWSDYRWCSGLKKKVDAKLWAKGQPEDPDLNHCLALNFEMQQSTLTGMVAAHCNMQMPVICQFPSNKTV
jgi:hypothetical protein